MTYELTSWQLAEVMFGMFMAGMIFGTGLMGYILIVKKLFKIWEDK